MNLLPLWSWLETRSRTPMNSRIFFGTPCYRSDPNRALQWAADMNRTLGGGCKSRVVHGCAWLHVAYAMIVKDFLESDCDRLMMRDDDVWPDAGTVARLRDATERSGAAVAPYLVRDEKRFDVVLDASGAFVTAGVGCCMIRRQVLKSLWSAYGAELGFRQDGTWLVAIFRDVFAERDDGIQLLKEDAAFWLRVRQAGFHVEVLDDVAVEHAGQKERYLGKHG